MADLSAIVDEILKEHAPIADMCEDCTHYWPCPEYRLAEDWKRMRGDLVRAWKNRSAAELQLVSKFICAGCSTRDTGLLCADCIAETIEGAKDVDAAIDN